MMLSTIIFPEKHSGVLIVFVLCFIVEKQNICEYLFYEELEKLQSKEIMHIENRVIGTRVPPNYNKIN